MIRSEIRTTNDNTHIYLSLFHIMCILCSSCFGIDKGFIFVSVSTYISIFISFSETHDLRSFYCVFVTDMKFDINFVMVWNGNQMTK